MSSIAWASSTVYTPIFLETLKRFLFIVRAVESLRRKARYSARNCSITPLKELLSRCSPGRWARLLQGITPAQNHQLLWHYSSLARRVCPLMIRARHQSSSARHLDYQTRCPKRWKQFNATLPSQPTRYSNNGQETVSLPEYPDRIL